MRIIGITGGVGSGKSRILDYIKENHNAYILKADELANELKTPGSLCYNELVGLLGEGILTDITVDSKPVGIETTDSRTDLDGTSIGDIADHGNAGVAATESASDNEIIANNVHGNIAGKYSEKKRTIDNRKMAALIFGDEKLLKKVNDIIHPKVREEILRRIDECKASGKYDLFILEAALLIEEGYDSILDELWYIYADEKVRRQRLKDSRGYSEEKITSIMQKQLSDEQFRKHCTKVIDNSYDMDNTITQLNKLL